MAQPKLIRLRDTANNAVSRLLYAVTVFALPVVLAIVTVLAFFSWDSRLQQGTATPLAFHVQEQTGADHGLTSTLRDLSVRAPVQYFDTNRSEKPFWLLFNTATANAGSHINLEFPSRHAKDLACWDAQTLSLLGEANRAVSNGVLTRAKAGFALDVGESSVQHAILCRGTFSGPARITLQQWNAAELQESMQSFERKAGLLDGGLVLLTLFVFCAAVLNREPTFVVFAMWLFVNLRLAALSSGWDTQWMGQSVPDAWIYPMRKYTTAAAYVLTITLFGRLFWQDLKTIGETRLIRVLQWSCLPLMVIAAVEDFSDWLPWLWGFVVFSIISFFYLLGKILAKTRSTVAMWYGASLGITLAVSFYEVAAAALNVKAFIGSINFATASLSSSLLASLAIAEQMRQDRAGRMRAQRELSTAYESLPIGLFTLAKDGSFIRSNPALRNMLGFRGPAAKVERWRDHFETNSLGALEVMIRSGTHEIELQGRDADGSDAKTLLIKASLNDDKIEGSMQDVTERTKATAKLRFLADNDPLTGIFNRRGIEKVLEKAIAETSKSNPLTIAYLDLDRFKLINDLFGHTAGDTILKEVCSRITELLTVDQQLGRVGGDEFLLVLRGTPVKSSQLTCRGIIDRISSVPYQIGESAYQVKVSIGAVEITSGTKVQDAISIADRACLEAKKGHTDGLVVYDGTSPAFHDHEAELRMVALLSSEKAPEGLCLEMQPIMSLSDPYDSLNFEMLLRMRQKDNTVISAFKILSAAEISGRSAVIDRWVLQTTLAWLDENFAKLSKTRFVCVNLSGGSLNDEHFINDAFSILADHPKTAERLCLEITESVALHDLDNTRRFINRARELGAKIALDDFGAGYTSLNYLKELPAEVLKLDGSLVKDMNKHPANLSIVRAIVELTRDLGMKSICEWAEDSETVETLANIGADYVQGYAIARPQEPSAILAATSCGAFIRDERLTKFFKNFALVGKSAIELEVIGGRGNIEIHPPKDLH
jgi:diguanylate cyclase (GGDEF)-like protein